MAELYLVRHGQASFGAHDYDRLSALGERQAIWLGEYFATLDIEFDRVIVGTMTRHKHTLDAILSGCGRSATRVEEHAGLNEYDFRALYSALGSEHGELAALAKGNMRDFYRGLKQVLTLWAENGLHGPVPETWAQFQQRVRAARGVIQQGPGQRVLAVSSGGAMAVMAQQVLDASSAAAIAMNMQIRNSSFCHYYFNAKVCRLASFNSDPHLDRPDRRQFQTYG